ncbi:MULTISPECIES: hypothetical protein [Streptomyces]|uniref:Lipoprotein n=2 Tax=Streptomyces rimosus subsp. rimosus TaxID=132474 RepID=L8EX80_STRR1|nr:MULTISPECIES: hypothetical protein [Streptomyces]KOG75535.1 lipoprotein [Kitasatospora aureofaciens]MYT48150.1 hypothetical protein [Streptomyces sp. SID5471]KOT46288.1 lipoprotein [Streptomyces rimosus subsp. rimosus]KOT47505.1 lipoprotein [Streptomyces sp. NRRL WC-3701]KOT61788.1 lipoprotein [Streptomyces rimosus subsp. rimosus]
MSKRNVLGTPALVTVAALALGLSACGPDGQGGDGKQTGQARDSAQPRPAPPEDGKGKDGTPTPKPEEKWDGKVRVLGDGSTSYTGPQPKQPKPAKLKPGEKPPQFVVFSWDGALEGDDHLFSHFREVAKQNNAQMTYFLTGTYLLPKSKATMYKPPQHKPGASAISYATDEHIKDTLRQLRSAWLEGNEIGTHFNGHFCGPKGGGDWSAAEWKSEIQQAYSFVQNWKTNTGYKNLPPLPFDYEKELVGGRAPCLEGQENLLTAAKDFKWRYDASSPGDFQVWPSKKNGIWNFPLQLLPYPKSEKQVLSMDFNFLYNQSGDNTKGDPAKYEQWRKLTRDGYLNGFNRVYHGSRAPLFIGNHFEDWNGGIYMKAIEDVVKAVCTKKEVRCATFKQVADWLDAQDPAVLERLRGLDPAQITDWSSVVK